MADFSSKPSVPLVNPLIGVGKRSQYSFSMNKKEERNVEVSRVQTGIRIEKRLLKVLKATAELKDMSLGDLLEGIVLHAFDGKSAFSPDTLKQISDFRDIYGLTLRASDSHKLKERSRRPVR